MMNLKCHFREISGCIAKHLKGYALDEAWQCDACLRRLVRAILDEKMEDLFFYFYEDEDDGDAARG
jgi:hypothetical protein